MGCPVRAWIGVMILYAACANYTVIGNMALSITAMVSSGKKMIPSECVKTSETNGTSAALPDYGPRYDWDETVQSRIIGAFFWGFITTSLPAGLIADWIGPYRTVIGTHIIMAICNSLCVPLAGMNNWLITISRFVIGMAAGLIYPALQSMIARWAPPAEKGKFISALLGNNLGTCIMWVCLGAITEKFGWAWGFHSITIFIFVFCIIFGVVASDGPDNHRWISEEERQFIIESQGGTVSKKKAIPPYCAMMKSGPLWMLIVLHFGNLWGLYLQMTGVPKFLAQAIGFTVKESGAVSAIPQLVRVFVGFGCGIIGDRMKKKQFSMLFIRKFFTIFSHLVPGVALACIGLVKCNRIMVAVLLTASQAINGAASQTALAIGQDLAPNFAGTIFGLQTLTCGTTGFITPILTGYLTKERSGVREWGINFLIGGCVYVACGIIYMLFGSASLQPWNQKKEDDND